MAQEFCGVKLSLEFFANSNLCNLRNLWLVVNVPIVFKSTAEFRINFDISNF
jgi:hypothetical protein